LSVVDKTALMFGVVIYCLIWLPLLRPGYLILLDVRFSPNNLGGMLYQHLLMALVWAGGAVAAWHWLKGVLLQPRVGALAAGSLLYMANPFTYQRLMVGHVNFLLGHALLPLWLLAWWRWRENPDWRRAGVIGIATLLIGYISLHHMMIMLVLGAVFFLPLVVERWREGQSLRPFWALAGMAASCGLIGLGYYAPISGQLATFDLGHFYAYASRPDATWGVVANLLMLHGFWREGVEEILPKSLWGWEWGYLLLISAALTGLWHLSRARQGIVWPVLLGATLCFALALGVSPLGYRLTTWLAQELPYYLGMRESQKWLEGIIPLLALGWASFVSAGMGWFSPKNPMLARLFAIVSIGLVVYLAWPLWYGGQRQLAMRHYPESWAVVDTYLQANHPEGKLTELPFSLYQRHAFVGRFAASPAKRYFRNPVTSSENAGIGTLEHRVDLLQAAVEDCLEENDLSCFRLALAERGIEFLLYHRAVEPVPEVELTALRENGWRMLLELDDVVLLQMTERDSGGE